MVINRFAVSQPDTNAPPKSSPLTAVVRYTTWPIVGETHQMEDQRIKLVQAALFALRRDVAHAAIPKAATEWGGANVVISRVRLSGRYRQINTPHALELSWLFERVRDAFSDIIDSCSKFELYGRLELAANRAQSRTPAIGARGLCLAVLEEGTTVLDELESGQFEYLPVALGTEIAAERSAI